MARSRRPCLSPRPRVLAAAGALVIAAAVPAAAERWQVVSGAEDAPLAAVEAAGGWRLALGCPAAAGAAPTLQLSAPQAAHGRLPMPLQTLAVTNAPYALFTPLFVAQASSPDSAATEGDAPLAQLRAVRTDPALVEMLQRAKTLELRVGDTLLASFGLSRSRAAIAVMLEQCQEWAPPAAAPALAPAPVPAEVVAQSPDVAADPAILP